MPQGKFKPAKASGSIVKKKSKSLRPGGDQQKLKHGNRDIKPKGISKKGKEAEVQDKITKQICSKIEQTMVGRASSDHGGLLVVKQAEGAGEQPDKKLKNPRFGLNKDGKRR